MMTTTCLILPAPSWGVVTPGLCRGGGDDGDDADGGPLPAGRENPPQAATSADSAISPPAMARRVRPIDGPTLGPTRLRREKRSRRPGRAVPEASRRLRPRPCRPTTRR